jgi:hypothetical protein
VDEATLGFSFIFLLTFYYFVMLRTCSYEEISDSNPDLLHGMVSQEIR